MATRPKERGGHCLNAVPTDKKLYQSELNNKVSCNKNHGCGLRLVLLNIALEYINTFKCF